MKGLVTTDFLTACMCDLLGYMYDFNLPEVKFFESLLMFGESSVFQQKFPREEEFFIFIYSQNSDIEKIQHAKIM